MAHDDNTHIMPGDQRSVLVHASELADFKIPDGQPDPRGWSVKTADGTTLGKVEDLLFDTGEARVRYLEVKTDGDFAKHGGRDYFLLPIGTARLDDDQDDVIVNMAATTLTGVPAYERGKVSREYETSLRDYVRERPRTGPTDSEVSFYGTPEYDDRSFFSRGRGAHTDDARTTREAADRATTGGLGDRIVDKLDDIHDRFDGNPASRPGPDATDRRV